VTNGIAYLGPTSCRKAELRRSRSADGSDGTVASFDNDERDDERDDGIYVAVPADPERERTVSDVLVETMANWGVTSVFGMVGHSNLGFAEAMRVAEERGDLRFFGIRPEGAAEFAASAYGTLTNDIAACFGIAGPGSTNLLTGLYDAKADVARYSESVHSGSNHAELMNMACKTAFGASFANHTGIAEYKPIIQVDSDPMALGRFHSVEVPVLGHGAVTARLLTARRCRSWVCRSTGRGRRALGNLAS
jgi:thiamine pyrophosphate-dependent acetolactate synthase large subunit-like protein